MRRATDWAQRHTALLGLVVIAAVMGIGYLPALKLSFYGDDWIFYDLAGRMPLADYLVKYFDPRVQTAWYRPVQGVLFRIEYAVFGANTLGYHLLNVLLHLANGCWVYAILVRVTSNRRLALVSALIFATLPTAAQAVFWPGVIDALETLFYLAAIWFWLAYLRSPSVHGYVAAFTAFLFALFTKEIGVTLPVTLWLVERFVERKPWDWRAFVRQYGPFFVVWAGYMPIEYIVARRSVFVNQIGYTPDALRLVTNLVDYLATLAFPWASIPLANYVWLAVVAALLAYLILARRRFALVPVIAMMVLGVLPVAAFPFVANRFLYLSLASSAVLYGLAIEFAIVHLPRARALAGVVTAVIAVLGSLSISNAAADFGEFARVSRVPFRNVSQAHPTFPEDTFLYFVDPPVPGPNLSGMFLWRYGPGVTVRATDIGVKAGLREHAAAFVYYFDGDGTQNEQRVDAGADVRVTPPLPAKFSIPVRLEGVELASSTVKRGQSILAFLYWRCSQRMDTDYQVSVRLADALNSTILVYDKPPRHGDAPTSSWVPGDLVVDVVQMPVPAQAPAGVYRALVGLYDPGTMKRIPLDTKGMTDITIEPVSITE